MNAKIIVKEPTCYKSLNNPSCIDLLLTNSSSSFPKYQGKSTGLSNFHKMITTVLKQLFKDLPQRSLFIETTKKLIGLHSKES